MGLTAACAVDLLGAATLLFKGQGSLARCVCACAIASSDAYMIKCAHAERSIGWAVRPEGARSSSYEQQPGQRLD